MLDITHYLGQYRMLSIDPGLNNIGLADFLLDQTRQGTEINQIEAMTIESRYVLDDCCYGATSDDERTRTRQSMVSAVLRKVREIHPAFVVIESPFYDIKRPGSYAVLLEVLNDLRFAIYQFDPKITIVIYAPQEVKKTLGVAGVKGKEIVKEAMSTFMPIVTVLKTDLGSMTEHAIDAVAVGYTYVKNILNREKQK